MERDATKRLTGRIEIDDAYLGGERNGGKRGRGSPGKTPIVAAVETTPEGKPIRLKLRLVKGFRRAEIATLARRNFQPASTVVSDGLHVISKIVTTQLVGDDFLRLVAGGFGIAQEGLTKGSLLLRISDFLFVQQHNGRRPLLIVDEAQHLSRTRERSLLVPAVSHLALLAYGPPDRAVSEAGHSHSL